MKESVQAAESFVKSRSYAFGIKPTVFEKKDIHVHVPEGATPKDGPSAGVAMVGPAQRSRYIVRVQAGDELEMGDQAIHENREAIEHFARSLHGAGALSSSGVYVRFEAAAATSIAELTRTIESLGEGIEVISIGHAMELSKEVGTPLLLEEKHRV